MRQFLAALLAVVVWNALTPARTQGQGPPIVGSVDEPRLISGEEAKERELELYRQQLETLRAELATAQDKAPDERLQKQVELQQKQIETLTKMIRLLGEQLKKAPPPEAAVEKLQTDTAVLQARSQQAARRDQELAYA